MQDVVIVGFGWVGQANALALSFLGFRVFFYDIRSFPPRRYGSVWHRHYDRIRPITDPVERDHETTVYLICVGDRVSHDGVQDVSLIRRAADALRGAAGAVVLRSTVLPEHLPQIRFDYYLPEFLHEKHAVEECLNPFLFVLGKADGAKPEPPFLREWEKRSHKSFRGTPREAAHIKYLSNIWNALRISFVNEMGDIISRGGHEHARSSRVLDFLFDGKSYLRYGKAYGGDCLPKDTLAFSASHKKSAVLLSAIHDANERHKRLGDYESLPEWFSRWELAGGIGGRLERLWRRFNALGTVRSIRRALRPLRRLLRLVAPTRTNEERKRLWNRLARRNALYYSYPNTPNGRRVSEYEFRETGKAEYERLVASDALLRSRLTDWRSCTVLDFGVGAGRHAERFARDFGRLIGIDISDEMLRAASARLVGFPNVTLFATDGAGLPVPGASVDFIFSRGTLESVPDGVTLRHLSREMFRVLRHGGMAKAELRGIPNLYRWRYSHGCAFSPEEARMLFEQAGFSVLSIAPDGKYLWVVVEKPSEDSLSPTSTTV